MAKILVPLAHGFEEIEAITIIDVCKRANIEVVVAGVNDMLVEGAHKIAVKCDCLLDNVDTTDIDMIVLAGGWGGTKILAEDERVQSILKDFKAKDKFIGAICAAPFALKSAGVLNENFTCYPSVVEYIKQDGYHNEDDVVIDSNVITSRGPATAMFFATEIVRMLVGDEVADRVSEGLLLR